MIIMISFLVEIYCDFGGYTDMARGTALLFGFNLPPNFSFSLVAYNLADFWRRHHSSMTNWFRDYAYAPLFLILPYRKMPLITVMVATSITFSFEPILPGFILKPSTPAAMAASAKSCLK